MSRADREKWNKRYEDGAYSGRTGPSSLPENWIHRIPPGRALDVACGAGRNALWLAGQGFNVDAIDISAAALARVGEAAATRGLAIRLLEHDLDRPLELEANYQLILMFRYVNSPLLRQLTEYLVPGGWLICEEHMVSDADVIGPQNPAYRVAPGALSAAVAGLDIVFVEEGVVAEPDGRLASLSRLVARRPG